jgi:hypothetical protein
MKYVFAAIIFLHGLIHLLGFVKGFGLKEIKELTLPISRAMGIVWLIAALLVVIYGTLHISNSRYSWLPGYVAVLVSQCLIIYYWKDAKFGTLPNAAILIVSIIAHGNFNFQKAIHRETTNLLSQIEFSNLGILSENDIQELPPPVERWLYRSGAVGRPHIRVGKVVQKAAMKMRPDQETWLDANAIQYTTIDIPSFIWSVNLKMNGLVSFQGRDKFEKGKGEMLIKINSLFNIVDEKGPKIDEGTIQRYLGEMVWFPSLALSPHITWKEVDDYTATATMDYNGTQGSGTFYFNAEGDFIKFSTMRYRGNETDAEKNEWVLSVDERKSFDGINVPSRMTATWKLAHEDWTWLKLEIADIAYNENALR